MVPYYCASAFFLKQSIGIRNSQAKKRSLGVRRRNMSDAKEKRKQERQDEGFSLKKAREDEEVEEFYAILRRLNAAVRYFKNYGDGVAALEKDILQDVKETITTHEIDLNLTPQNPLLTPH
ncbi:hypothetical protein VNO78_18995 [Psophocarpus tetragonolobus]|uniref:Uncharacterized protein n=1 Tax=Psophocarpus tetragonolobus TaxID=3891 RepID=A0AAN9S880_PSOTE